MNDRILIKEAEVSHDSYARYNIDSISRNTIKYRLYLIRKWFDCKPFYYISLKIFVGFMLLLLPFIFFLYDANHSIGNFPVSKFSKSVIPLIIAVSFVLVYIIILIVFGLCKLCKTIMFPSWDRFSLGRTLEALIVLIGVFFFFIKLMDCLSYIDNFTQKLSLIFQSKEIRSFLSSKFSLLSIIFSEDLSSNNERKRLINWHYMKNHIRILRNNDPSFKGINLNIIYQSFFELCGPILFLSLYFVLRLFLISSKNTFLYLTMVGSLIYECCCIKYNICTNNKAFCYSLAPSIFFSTYLIIVVINLNNYLKKKVNCLQTKIVFALFEVLVSLALFLIVFLLIYILTTNANILNDKKVYFMIRNTFATSLLLILIGNCFNFGDFIVELLFRPIEKELFPCKNKEFYKRTVEVLVNYIKSPQIDNTEITYN